MFTVASVRCQRKLVSCSQVWRSSPVTAQPAGRMNTGTSRTSVLLIFGRALSPPNDVLCLTTPAAMKLGENARTASAPTLNW